MGSRREHDAITDACLHAARLIEESGSPALRRVMHALLYVLGRELAEQMSDRERSNGHVGEHDEDARHDDEPSH